MTHHKNSVNFVCCASITVLGMYLAAYQTALPAIQAEYAASGMAGGLIVSLHFTACFLFPFLFGALADRIGRKPVLIGCFLLLLGGLVLVVRGGSLLLTAIGIFCIGGPNALLESSLSSLLSDNNPGREGLWMNLSQMCFCAGAAASPLTSTLFGSWQRNYFAIGILYALCLTALILTPLSAPAAVSGEAADERADNRRADFGRLFKKHAYLLLLASMFLYISLEEGAAFWCGEFVLVSLGDRVNSANYLSVYWLGMALGRLFCSLFARQFDRHRHAITLGGTVSSAVFFAGMLAAGRFPADAGRAAAVLMLVCFFGAGAGMSAVWPYIMTETTVSNPELPNTAAGGVSSAGAFSGMLTPILLGLVSEVFGVQSSFLCLLGAVLMVCAALICLRALSLRKGSSFRNEKSPE